MRPREVRFSHLVATTSSVCLRSVFFRRIQGHRLMVSWHAYILLPWNIVERISTVPCLKPLTTGMQLLFAQNALEEIYSWSYREKKVLNNTVEK